MCHISGHGWTSRPRSAAPWFGFALQGLAWVADPARSAAGLGMPLLDGLGRSTQAGDFASFFLTAGVTMLLPGRQVLILPETYETP